MAQLGAHDVVPRWALDDSHETPFWSVTRTDDELSIICAYEALPGTVTAVGPFAAFSIDGPLDHSLIGVLAGLTAPLADAGISILAAVHLRHRLDPGAGRPGRPRDRGLGGRRSRDRVETEERTGERHGTRGLLRRPG